MLDVRRWAEIRRMAEVEGLSIREIARRTGHDRNTVRRALRREGPPVYRRDPRPSKLDPFRELITELLRCEPKIPGKRVRELIEAEGYEGSKTILDDYLRELRPIFSPPRTFRRTVYRSGEICQFDLWRPRAEIPVGHGQTRPGYVVVCCLGYSRAGAGALVFSKQAADLSWGMSRCLKQLGGLPKTLVWDREGALHASRGEPTDEFAALCGSLGVGWHFCEPADPEAKGAVERLQGFIETSFEPARSFANHLDFQDRLDRWFRDRANARFHRGIRAVPAERLAEELEVMRALPERMPASALLQGMSQKKFASLKPDQQKAVRAAGEEMSRWLKPHTDAWIEKRLAEEKEKGGTVITLTAAESARLAQEGRRGLDQPNRKGMRRRYRQEAGRAFRQVRELTPVSASSCSPRQVEQLRPSNRGLPEWSVWIALQPGANPNRA